MSLGYNGDSIIGGPFDPAVNKQLEVRKEILKNRDFRSDYDLQYLTQTNAWIRAISSINDTEFDSDIRNQPATRYILQAGTGKAKYVKTSPEDSPETTLRYDGIGIRGGFEAVDGFQSISSYTTTELTGFTPMPGITNFTIRSKNTFGTLREATLEFTAHSIEDFNNLEKLFMRPGYTVLVEWGHTHFIDNEKQLQTRASLYNVKDFLSGQSTDTIEQNIIDLKKTNSGNYDAFYGFIKNFSWTYNGSSYICSIDIISKGELIESITMDIPATGPGAPTSTDDDESKKYNGRQISTDVHKFLFSIINAQNKKYEKISDGGVEEGITNKAIEDYVYIWNTDLYTQVKSDIVGTGVKLRDSNNPIASQVIRYQISTDSASTELQWSRAITLRMLLSILNNTFLLKSENGVPLFKFFIGNEKTQTPFYTFDEHIGLDPGICIIGRNSQSTQQLMWSVSKQAELSVEEQKDILNIFIDATHIMDLLDSHIEKAGEKPPVLATFILELLRSIQRNLGNINEFDIHHDDSTSTLYIVDRKIVPDKTKSHIDLLGLNSQIENFNISSKLSSNIASMMALAASDKSPAGLAGDMLNVQKWNEGLYDRHLKSTQVGNASKEYWVKSRETEYVTFYTGVDRDGDTAIRQVRKDRSGFKFREYINWIASSSDYFLQYTQEDLEGYQRSHIKEMRELGKLGSELDATNPSGLVPFELSFTMKGIGGLKIGQAFTIPYTFLPIRYKDRVGFLITGIEHRLAEGRWVTDIKTQMIVLPAYDKKILPPTPPPPKEDASGDIGLGWDEPGEQSFKTTLISYSEAIAAIKKVTSNVNLQKMILTVLIREQGSGQQIKGFNYNFGGYDITQGRWRYDSFGPNISNGYVYATEGGTKRRIAYVSFVSTEAFLKKKLKDFTKRGFANVTTPEQAGNAWYAKWNGYGAREIWKKNAQGEQTKYPTLALWDAYIVKTAADVYKKVQNLIA